MSQDYNSTINLPRTEFSMRAGLPAREPEMLKSWEEQDVYSQLMQKNKDKPLYILHDGPPYANGDIHLGHAFNKILKDFIIRYRNMSGYKAPYVPGWDTHGLPIESQIIKKYGVGSLKASPAEFREKCREFALKYVENQKHQFKRLGVLGEWDKPYLTLEPAFEARQIEVFGAMAKKGLIYKGLKPVYWCAHDETALAEAEIEYQDDECESIYVKFRVENDSEKLAKFGNLSDIYFVIWTTTTWTLPGNLAIALNAGFEYSLVRVKSGEIYIIASELCGDVMKTAGIPDYEIIGKMQGNEFENMTARHPFIDRESLIILGDHVTLEAGTGCVHTAPGHGAEDFIACRDYGLPVIVPVDSKGYMNDYAGKYAGMYYAEANNAILRDLSESGALLASRKIAHTYPHCWRCKHPIVYRATEQWFASIDPIKDEAERECHNVEWIPAWGEERIISMVRERSDWCISRQRVWGVPIPIFYCSKCGEPLINDDTIKAVSDLFRKHGSSVWYELDASEILPEGTKCPKCENTGFTKETDIMDVWFDSGSSHFAVLETRDNLRWPADMYLEGGDQFRGWFQSSLLTSVATCGKAPYKSVLTNGWVVDGEGRKMSKSLGNVIAPQDVIKEYGADILRLLVSSADYRVDIRISKEIFKQLSEIYLKVRNTSRFILGNLSGFDPNSQVKPGEMPEIDRWALNRLNRLIEKVLRAYEDYEYHIIYHAIHNFCVIDMSNFYLDVIKDRLYCDDKDGISRKSAQTVIYKILDAMVRMLCPILAYTSDEIWKAMPHHDGVNTEHVILNDMPKPDPAYYDSELEQKWDRILALRDDANRALESARAARVIGKSLEASVVISAKGEDLSFIKSIGQQLTGILIVSNLEITDTDIDGISGENYPGVKIRVAQASGVKCPRCWVITENPGTNPAHPELCPRCTDVVSRIV